MQFLDPAQARMQTQQRQHQQQPMQQTHQQQLMVPRARHKLVLPLPVSPGLSVPPVIPSPLVEASSSPLLPPSLHARARTLSTPISAQQLTQLIPLHKQSAFHSRSPALSPSPQMMHQIRSAGNSPILNLQTAPPADLPTVVTAQTAGFPVPMQPHVVNGYGKTSMSPHGPPHSFSVRYQPYMTTQAAQKMAALAGRRYYQRLHQQAQQLHRHRQARTPKPEQLPTPPTPPQSLNSHSAMPSPPQVVAGHPSPAHLIPATPLQPAAYASPTSTNFLSADFFSQVSLQSPGTVPVPPPTLPAQLSSAAAAMAAAAAAQTQGNPAGLTLHHLQAWPGVHGLSAVPMPMPPSPVMTPQAAAAMAAAAAAASASASAAASAAAHSVAAPVPSIKVHAAKPGLPESTPALAVPVVPVVPKAVPAAAVKSSSRRGGKSGTKNFRCRFCGKCWHTKWEMERHERTHSGEKPHQCDICHRRFTQKGDLTRHKYRYTGITPFKCTHCNQTFSRKSSLTVHLRHKHNIITKSTRHKRTKTTSNPITTTTAAAAATTKVDAADAAVGRARGLSA